MYGIAADYIIQEIYMRRKNLLFNILIIAIITIIIIVPSKTVYMDDCQEGAVDFELIDAGNIEECIIDMQKAPVISAAAAIVMDRDTGRILYEKNAHKKLPMASTTKIMTGIIAIERGNLDDTVTVSKRASQIRGSVIGLYPGEELKLRELLYGLMLNSGNDAAIAIAEHIGGTVENFLEMMNEKARLIGARSTNFKSPHGLDMDGHYSTAYDLALIAKYALENQIFSEIVAMKEITIPKRSLHNTNEMLSLYPGADGVKTGYTGKAGRCLVTSAAREGFRIISVVLNCSSRYMRTKNSKEVLDYAFNNYKMHVLLEPGEIIGQLPVKKGLDENVHIVSSEKIIYPLTQDEAERLETKILLAESLNAPVYGGMDAGYVKFILDGNVLAESRLKIWKDVERKNFRYYLDNIIMQWLKLVKQLH